MSRTIIFLLFLLSSVASKAQKEIDLFIWAGQSNAQGWMGDATYYPEDVENLDSIIKLCWTFVDNAGSEGQWITMQPQQGRFPKGHFGPEVSFSRELKKAGYNLAIFKYTKGATGLASDWKLPGAGGIYDRMIVELKKAIKLLEDQEYSVNIRGFIWIQGETDAGNEDDANNYSFNLKKLIGDLRTNIFPHQCFKVILGVDEQHPFVQEKPVVVEAQKRIAAGDPDIAFVSMVGLPKADATHLTPAGLITHGKKIFKGFINLTEHPQESFAEPEK